MEHAVVLGAPVHRTSVFSQVVDHAGTLLVVGRTVVMHVSQTFSRLQFGHWLLPSESLESGAPSPGPGESPSAARAARGNSRKVAIVETFMVALSARSISVCIYVYGNEWMCSYFVESW